MNYELQLAENPKLIPAKAIRRHPRDYPGAAPKLSSIIDICEISTNVLYFNIKRPNTEFFQSSLYEIDRLLRDRNEPEDKETLELMRQKLPKQYAVLKDAFSKSESNRLPPYRVYDHKIELEKELTFGYIPLYKQSTEELKAVK